MVQIQTAVANSLLTVAENRQIQSLVDYLKKAILQPLNLPLEASLLDIQKADTQALTSEELIKLADLENYLKKDTLKALGPALERFPVANTTSQQNTI